MENNRTLKEIYDVFEDISGTHSNINDFGVGDILKINESYSLQHVTLWTDVQSSTVENNLINLSFLVYVFDLVDQNDFQETSVLSNTMVILQDVITSLKQTYRLIPEQYNIPIQPFTHKFADRVSGWFGEINVRVPYNYGVCDLPITES